MEVGFVGLEVIMKLSHPRTWCVIGVTTAGLCLLAYCWGHWAGDSPARARYATLFPWGNLPIDGVGSAVRYYGDFDCFPANGIEELAWPPASASDTWYLHPGKLSRDGKAMCLANKHLLTLSPESSHRVRLREFSDDARQCLVRQFVLEALPSAHQLPLWTEKRLLALDEAADIARLHHSGSGRLPPRVVSWQPVDHAPASRRIAEVLQKDGGDSYFYTPFPYFDSPSSFTVAINGTFDDTSAAEYLQVVYVIAAEGQRRFIVFRDIP